MPICFPAQLLLTFLTVLSLAGCTASDKPHVQNDPGGGATGAVSNDLGTSASGSLNGYGTADGDPITSTGNLGSGSTESDPVNGVNQTGPAVPF